MRLEICYTLHLVYMVAQHSLLTTHKQTNNKDRGEEDSTDLELSWKGPTLRQNTPFPALFKMYCFRAPTCQPSSSWGGFGPCSLENTGCYLQMPLAVSTMCACAGWMDRAGVRRSVSLLEPVGRGHAHPPPAHSTAPYYKELTGLKC